MPSDILYPDISEASGLVMEEEEKERREEAERWREREEQERKGMGPETATLPVRRPWIQPHAKFVTKAIMEGARNLGPNDGPTLNGGLLSSGGDARRNADQQTELDEKPPKLVVNLNQSDKASQIPEPTPDPTPDSQLTPKKADETDGQREEDSCLVDCLFYTLQCCDCAIM